MSDALTANMVIGMMRRHPPASDLYCTGVGKVVNIENGNFFVELAFRTSSYSQKNQIVIAQKTGLLGYEIAVGDMVVLGQARTLTEGFKAKVDLSVAYILDKLEPARGLSLTVVDTFDFLDKNGDKLLSITPSGVTIHKAVTALDTITAPSVEANGVKLESHFHDAGALVAPNGPVTGSTGGPF